MNEGAGRIVRGGLEVWFNTDTPGGAGMHDIWHATRASTAEPFGNLEPVFELNSAGNDWDVWVSEDTRYVVFGTNRDGQYEIYEAFR